MKPDSKMYETLKAAQDKYGYSNQVTVATEELCELAMVLCKYPRYPSHEQAAIALRSKVVEEISDVYIVLAHLRMIFGIRDEEINRGMDVKLERLERWLQSDKGFEQTMVDREVRCPHNTLVRELFADVCICAACGEAVPIVDEA